MTMIVVGQIRGTGYAIAEIVWWMLAALLVGIALGWLLGSFGKAKRVEAEYSQQLDSAEARDADTTRNLERITAELETAHSRIGELEATIGEQQSRISALEAEIAAVESPSSNGMPSEESPPPDEDSDEASAPLDVESDHPEP